MFCLFFHEIPLLLSLFNSHSMEIYHIFICVIPLYIGSNSIHEYKYIIWNESKGEHKLKIKLLLNFDFTRTFPTYQSILFEKNVFFLVWFDLEVGLLGKIFSFCRWKTAVVTVKYLLSSNTMQKNPQIFFNYNNFVFCLQSKYIKHSIKCFVCPFGIIFCPSFFRCMDML